MSFLILSMRPADAASMPCLPPSTSSLTVWLNRTASAIPGARFVSMQYGTLEQMTFEQVARRAGDKPLITLLMSALAEVGD